MYTIPDVQTQKVKIGSDLKNLVCKSPKFNFKHIKVLVQYF